MKLTSFYIVVTEFERVGFGSAGDATTSSDDAYDQFAGCIEDNAPARAFRLDFDHETGALETTTEVTGDFADELSDITYRRELSLEAAE